MKCVEPKFEKFAITKAAGTGDQTTDFSVGSLYFSTDQAGFVQAQDSFGMTAEGFGHRLKLLDTARFSFGAPLPQECPCLAPVGLHPELAEFILGRLAALQGIIDFQTSFQSLDCVFLQFVGPVQ